MCKILLTLLVTFILFSAAPAKLQALEPSEEAAMASDNENETLILEEIQVQATSIGGGVPPDDQSGCSNELPSQVPVGTTELWMECKRNESWGWVEAGQTLKFSYPLQISPDAPGEFIADAFGGFLWNVGYYGGSARLELQIEGEWGDRYPECEEKKFEYASGGGDNTVNKSIHLNAKCSYTNQWWYSDDATFQFFVYTNFDRKVCKPTCNYVNEIKQLFRVLLRYRKGSADPVVLSINKTGTGTGTVNSSPAGINCGIDCSESYPFGTSITLTAISLPGSVFGGWSGGGCSGTGKCTVIMTNDVTVTATFNESSGTSANIPIQVLLLGKPVIIPGESCDDGKVYDCAELCVHETMIMTWLGDGVCDDGTFGVDLNCKAFDYDAGDCL